MNIHPIQKFIPILKLKINNYNTLNNQFNKFIPIEWQFILTNNGSFTQNLNSLLMNKADIEMSQKYNKISEIKSVNIRIIWLKNNINDRFTFAHSIWIFNSSSKKYLKLLTNKPIGQSFIEYEIDLYKDLQEISYGYCHYLENQFKCTEPIWARKYKIYYKNNSYAIIEEFFSPKLINFFY